MLAGSGTVSAAETLRSGDEQLSTVTIVGEPTAGVLSDSTPKFLPSGIYFSLSNEEYKSPSDVVYESTGVPPDVEVPLFPLSDREVGEDSAIKRRYVSSRSLRCNVARETQGGGFAGSGAELEIYSARHRHRTDDGAPRPMDTLDPYA